MEKEKVIVVEQIGVGGVLTHVYKYSKEKMRELVEAELEWAIETGVIENEDEVMDTLEEDEIMEAHIYEKEYGIYYMVYEIE